MQKVLLSWQHHANDLAIKLNRNNGLVLLKYHDPFMEYTIFESCLSCGYLVWLRISALFSGL